MRTQRWEKGSVERNKPPTPSLRSPLTSRPSALPPAQRAAGHARLYALDPFEHVVVVGEQVRVRSEPTLSGSVLGSLTYQVVPRAPVDGVFETTADGYTWVPIRLASGERGWIADTFVRSPVGLRAGFEKRGSTWQILYFVEGD